MVQPVYECPLLLSTHFDRFSSLHFFIMSDYSKYSSSRHGGGGKIGPPSPFSPAAGPPGDVIHPSAGSGRTQLPLQEGVSHSPQRDRRTPGSSRGSGVAPPSSRRLSDDAGSSTLPPAGDRSDDPHLGLHSDDEGDDLLQGGGDAADDDRRRTGDNRRSSTHRRRHSVHSRDSRNLGGASARRHHSRTGVTTRVATAPFE